MNFSEGSSAVALYTSEGLCSDLFCLAKSKAIRVLKRHIKRFSDGKVFSRRKILFKLEGGILNPTKIHMVCAGSTYSVNCVPTGIEALPKSNNSSLVLSIQIYCSQSLLTTEVQVRVTFPDWWSDFSDDLPARPDTSGRKQIARKYISKKHLQKEGLIEDRTRDLAH